MSDKIAVVGFGEIGRALNGIIKAKGFAPEVWDKDESKVPERKKLEEVLSGAGIVFLCVPSQSVRDALSFSLGLVDRASVFVFISKGIEIGTGKSMAEIGEELVPGGKFGILSGPMLAEELSLGMPGAGVFASPSQSEFEKIKNIFGGTALKVEYSNDITGVALAGVLKNIYAVSLGIAEGLKWGMNARGFLVSKIAGEMESVITDLGGRRETALSPAGLGDLIATGFSPHSNNRRAGFEIASEGSCKTDCEGLLSIRPFIGLLKNKGTKTPVIMAAVMEAFLNPSECRKIFNELIQSL